MSKNIDKLISIIKDSQSHNQHIVECVEQNAEQGWQLPMTGTAQVVTFATVEECEMWQAALDECGYEVEIVECIKKGNGRYHVNQSMLTCGYDHSDIINASTDDYIWRKADVSAVDEYVADWFYGDEYEGWYKDLILERAEALKDALQKEITSTGCIITDYELDILDTLVDDKPVMGLWDKFNNVEYRFGLNIYGA